MSVKITVLVVEPEKAPYIKEIDPGLKSLQQEVGGDIQAIYPFLEPAAIVCNESGKLDGLPLNRALRGEDGKAYDIIAGTFLVVGLGEEDFTSLSPELNSQFRQHFQRLETFLRINGSIVVMPFER